MTISMIMIKLASQARYLDSLGRHVEADAITQLVQRGQIRVAGTGKSVYDNRNFENTFLYSIVSPDGYKIIHELVNMFGDDTTPAVPISSAYTLDGQYIGSPDDAKRLLDKGIAPEISKPDHKVCSIGFCDREQKWYGWSHRAIKGFGIGDTPEQLFPEKTVKGKPIQTLDEAKQAAIDFAESVS